MPTTLSRCTKKEMKIAKLENQNRFGGQSVKKKSFLKRFQRKATGSYSLSVTALSTMIFN
jgi:hypothetical protein